MKTFSTSEELNHHVDNLSPEVRELLAHPPQDKTAALVQLCPLYQSIRPFLASLVNVFFLPQKLKDLISGLLTVVDLICASGTPSAPPPAPEAPKHEMHKHESHKKK